MSEAWKKMDLEGGGLQSLQLRLLRSQKKLPTAYASWLLFPLGAHRIYLKQPWFWLYPLVTLAAIGLLWAGLTLVGGVLLGLIAAAAIYDLLHIPDRVSRLNKELRKSLWLSKEAPPPPADFKGRYSDYDSELQGYVKAKEQERAGHPAPRSQSPGNEKGYGAGKRAPSFAEQERLLAELAKSRKPAKDK
ncbi:TM2 domain-containing protein [Thermithiobacillus plumbiphilus]|uniref:TM2 domain-containing protein n=1 Tax=Thermithiobacillus plumbiphilus TaxID=1729899 RepID=A0ABU9D6J8_9PROT